MIRTQTLTETATGSKVLTVYESSKVLTVYESTKLKKTTHVGCIPGQFDRDEIFFFGATGWFHGFK